MLGGKVIRRRLGEERRQPLGLMPVINAAQGAGAGSNKLSSLDPGASAMASGGNVRPATITGQKGKTDSIPYWKRPGGVRDPERPV